MSAAVNLYLSVLAGWAGIILAVCVLVYLCHLVCLSVAHEWKLRRVWRDRPLTRATPGVVSPSKRPFDQAREV